MRLYFSSQYPIDQILCTNTLINKLNTLRSYFHPFKAQYCKVLYKFQYIETLTSIYSKCIFQKLAPFCKTIILIISIPLKLCFCNLDMLCILTIHIQCELLSTHIYNCILYITVYLYVLAVIAMIK